MAVQHVSSWPSQPSFKLPFWWLRSRLFCGSSAGELRLDSDLPSYAASSCIMQLSQYAGQLLTQWHVLGLYQQ